MENKSPAIKITINKLDKTFSDKIENDNGVGYILGYVKENEIDEKIWYSTYISGRLVWSAKANFKKVYDILLPLTFKFTFRAYNLDTKEEGTENEEFDLSAEEVAKIIMKKDNKNVLTKLNFTGAEVEKFQDIDEIKI